MGVQRLETLHLLDGEGPRSRLPEIFTNNGVLVKTWLLDFAWGHLHEREMTEGGPIQDVLLVGGFAGVRTVGLDAISEEWTAGDVAVLRTVDLHACVAAGDQLRLLRKTKGAAQLLLSDGYPVVGACQPRNCELLRILGQHLTLHDSNGIPGWCINRLVHRHVIHPNLLVELLLQPSYAHVRSRMSDGTLDAAALVLVPAAAIVVAYWDSFCAQHVESEFFGQSDDASHVQKIFGVELLHLQSLHHTDFVELLRVLRDRGDLSTAALHSVLWDQRLNLDESVLLAHGVKQALRLVGFLTADRVDPLETG